MTQNLFDRVIDCSEAINSRFSNTGALGKVYRTEILADKEYSSLRYRRAHISTIDARETKKLYLLHVTVFPHTNDPSPIYGFDIVCGPTKVSGAFHDFSISGDPTSPCGYGLMPRSPRKNGINLENCPIGANRSLVRLW